MALGFLSGWRLAALNGVEPLCAALGLRVYRVAGVPGGPGGPKDRSLRLQARAFVRSARETPDRALDRARHSRHPPAHPLVALAAARKSLVSRPGRRRASLSSTSTPAMGETSPARPWRPAATACPRP